MWNRFCEALKQSFCKYPSLVAGQLILCLLSTISTFVVTTDQRFCVLLCCCVDVHYRHRGAYTAHLGRCVREEFDRQAGDNPPDMTVDLTNNIPIQHPKRQRVHLRVANAVPAEDRMLAGITEEVHDRLYRRAFPGSGQTSRSLTSAQLQLLDEFYTKEINK